MGKAMGDQSIHRSLSLPAEAVREALARVCENPSFKASPRLSAFLRYVVNAALEGRADSIKAYSIAVDALERPDNFDPISDAIVRVEARRLRRALAHYYENGGSQDPVVIDIPLGRYVPEFRWRAPDRPDGGCRDERLSAFAIEPVGPTVHERRARARSCQLQLAVLRDRVTGLRAEMMTSRSIVTESRRLIERWRSGRPCED
jgi:hypothetical protein